MLRRDQLLHRHARLSGRDRIGLRRLLLLLPGGSGVLRRLDAGLLREPVRAAPAALLLSLGLAACGGEQRAPHVPSVGEVEAQLECTEPAAELPSGLFQNTGVLGDTEFWDCPRPQPSEGRFIIDGLTGHEAAVTGSTAEISIDWDGPEAVAGRNLLFWFGAGEAPSVRNGLVTSNDGDGFYRWLIPDEADPITLDFVLDPDAVGTNYLLSFAIDETVGDPVEPVIGPVATQSLFVIKVGSGDIQINLNWPTLVDLDLWVTDPTDFEIFYGDKEAPSGGMLDLDSYPVCSFEGDRGRGNENVFWPVGAAPDGQYLVQVRMFDDCGTYAADVATPYRVTVVQHGEVDVISGSFEPTDGTLGSEHDAAAFTY